MFTSDGIVPLEGKQVTVLSTKFGGKERNAAVLRNVLMWSMLLANDHGDIRVAIGGSYLAVDAVPALASIRAGIDGDSMKLDRIFADEAGGEVTAESNAGDEELEQALSMAATGALAPDDEAGDLDGEVAS
jgi:hypothetical protein